MKKNVSTAPDSFWKKTEACVSNSRRRGQALVPVIFIMLILTTLIVGFSISASREVRAGKNFSNQTARFYAARGAVYYAASALAKSSDNGVTYGVVSGTDFDSKGWMQVGDAWVKFDVIDTGGLINLNSVDATTLSRIPVFKNNSDLAACIIDWRTPGDQASQNGAKSDYYQGLTPPYDCKSMPFDSVEELLLVKGMTPEILFGNGAGSPVASNASDNGGNGGSNASSVSSSKGLTRQVGGGGASSGNGTPPPPPTGGTSGGSPAGATGQTDGADTMGDTDWDDTFSSSKMPLSELFTTVARERNLAADGSARVNINTATADDLVQKVGLSQELANLVVTHRQGGATGGGNGGGGGGGNPRPGGIQPPGGGGNQPPGNPNGGAGQPGGGRPGSSLGRPNGASIGLGQGGGLGRNSRQVTGSLGVQSGGGQGGGGLQTGGNRPGGFGVQGGGSGASGGGQSGGNPTGANPGGANGATPGGGGAGQTGGTGTSGPVFKSIADLMAIPNRRQTFDRETMQQIADKVTVDDMPYHENLVNINTATMETLATVQGMDHATAQAILDYRADGKAFQSLGDLFSISSITRQQYINILPHICTKSSVYRVRIRVRIKGGSSTYAAVALIEMTDNGPRVRQWREVPRASGWNLWVDSASLPSPAPPTSNAKSQ